MKTTARKYQAYGDTALVQISIDPETAFGFKPGGPEIMKGRLVITEANEGGVVGRLAAINKTDDYLLLTDADVLIGAKQNRVLNKSMLLAPNSKTIIDVSCIERLRWNYTSRNFASPGSSADPRLRKAKAASLGSEAGIDQDQYSDTQSRVWSHISFRLDEGRMCSPTESYHEMMDQHMRNMAEKLPVFEPEEGCHGLAVMTGDKVQCIDLFGKTETYRHYFPLLRDAALLNARSGKGMVAAGIHEAYFRVLDAIDNSETAGSSRDGSYAGSGIMEIRENENLIGMELSMEDQLVHKVLFMK